MFIVISDKLGLFCPSDHKGHDKKASPGQRKEAKSFLRPSSKDTPRRVEGATSPIVSPKQKKKTSSRAAPKSTTTTSDFNTFFDAGGSDPFSATDFGQNFFKSAGDDESTGSGHPFFSQSNSKQRDPFDPRNYKTEAGR